MPDYTYSHKTRHNRAPRGEDARITATVLTVRCGDGLCGLLNPVPRCEACKKARVRECMNFVTLTRTVQKGRI